MPPAPTENGRPRPTFALPAIVLTAALFLTVLVTRAYCLQLFHDLGARLPRLTILLTSPYFLGFCGVLSAVAILTQRIMTVTAARAVCNLVAVALAFLLGALYFLAILLPMLSLCQTLGAR